jgi:hypothetical protein
MKKLLLSAAGLAVALTAMPAEARHHSRMASNMVCTKWRAGTCVKMHRVSKSAVRHARYRNGYVFGPRYAYTSYNRLPRAYVVRYDLSPNYRYVYRDNYIYVVDPKTYAVQRIISAIVR